MAKKNKPPDTKKDKDNPLSSIVLITAVINLLKAIIDLIKSLLT